MHIGIDIGGTNLAAATVEPGGCIAARGVLKAADYPTAEGAIAALAALAREAAAQAGARPEDIDWVGVGVPGWVDRQKGEVIRTVNAPFDRTPFARLFRREWDVPVFLENDANCAALGELAAGAGRGVRSLLMITLGTGVGGALATGGKLRGSVNLTAMEAGHMVIKTGGHPCPCGRRGCWKQYASAPGLRRLTREEMLRSPESAMWTLCGGSLEEVGGRTAFQAARMGDAAAKRVTEEYLDYLAEGLTNLVNLFQPELICLGGGVSNEREEDLLLPLRERVARWRYSQGDRCPQSRIEKAALGNDAGLVGAALRGDGAYFADHGA